MNVLTMNAYALGNAVTRTNEQGTPKTIFTVETDAELPLHFNCIAFGASAERASRIVEGDEVLLSGKLTTSAATKKMTVVVNAIEILTDLEEIVTAGGK